jgi:hypothetical protein
MNTEKSGRETGWRGWKKLVVAAGAGALAVSLTSCGAVKGAAREADNPAAREAAAKMLHVGEETAKDFSKFGSKTIDGFAVSDVDNILKEKMVVGRDNYSIDIEHKPGALADQELSDEEKEKITCAVDAIVQFPSGVREYVNGTSVWQRGVDDRWAETVVKENKGGPLDLCKLALSAMPGAGNE